jgi:ADP-L-glycero-D-manno-heptose 6-epimerase
MIVITGGSGFIGSVLLKHLNNQGYKDILVVDHFGESSKWKNLNGKIYTDIVEKSEFRNLLSNSVFLNNCKVIYHLGACSSTTEKNVSYLLDNNTNYSKALFSFCTLKKIPFIYASSAATYGNGEHGYSDLLSQELNPINPYGFSKHIFDNWALRQRACPPVWLGLKFFNVYGPNEYHKGEMQSLIAKAVPQIQQTKKLKLFKSYRSDFSHGEQQRDFIYVKDAAAIMTTLWENYSQKKHDIISGVYNLGTGESRSFLDLGKAVFKSLGEKENFEWIEMPEEIKNQYQYYTKSDNHRLYKNTFSSNNFTSLEKGVKDYVQNYLLSKKHL